MTPAWEKPMKLLNEMDASIRIKALREIGKLKAQECNSDVIRLLKDENDDVKLEAIITLGNIADPAVGEELLTYLNAKDVPFLMELINSLGILGAHGFTKTADAITPFLEHSNFRIRKFTIQALGKCGNSASIEKLYEIFQRQESSVETRELITEMIGQIGGSRAIEILKDLSKEGLVEIRRSAIKALGLMRSQIALELLGRIYNDKNDDKIVRKHAEDSIKKIIEGAHEYYLEIKQHAEDLLKGK